MSKSTILGTNFTPEPLRANLSVFSHIFVNEKWNLVQYVSIVVKLMVYDSILIKSK